MEAAKEHADTTDTEVPACGGLVMLVQLIIKVSGIEGLLFLWFGGRRLIHSSMWNLSHKSKDIRHRVLSTKHFQGSGRPFLLTTNVTFATFSLSLSLERKRCKASKSWVHSTDWMQSLRSSFQTSLHETERSSWHVQTCFQKHIMQTAFIMQSICLLYVVWSHEMHAFKNAYKNSWPFEIVASSKNKFRTIVPVAAVKGNASSLQKCSFRYHLWWYLGCTNLFSCAVLVHC